MNHRVYKTLVVAVMSLFVATFIAGCTDGFSHPSESVERYVKSVSKGKSSDYEMSNAPELLRKASKTRVGNWKDLKVESVEVLNSTRSGPGASEELTRFTRDVTVDKSEMKKLLFYHVTFKVTFASGHSEEGLISFTPIPKTKSGKWSQRSRPGTDEPISDSSSATRDSQLAPCSSNSAPRQLRTRSHATSCLRRIWTWARVGCHSLGFHGLGYHESRSQQVRCLQARCHPLGFLETVRRFLGTLRRPWHQRFDRHS